MPVEPTLLIPTSAKQLLRDDDSLLRQVFFNVLRHHHPNTANKVDVIYALSQAWCKSKDDSDFDLLEKYLNNLKPEECILVRWRRNWSVWVAYSSEINCNCVSCTEALAAHRIWYNTAHKIINHDTFDAGRQLLLPHA
eukprot:GHUV01020271.1.p1 GENE.GHUV01020271.1~~GHUV01020271.1.p1  ORF type:complete len:138 (+),score=14.72 GHUV01020271.1:206-619(+)